MGLTASKVCKQVPQKDLQEGSIPSTPIVAPKAIKNEDLDPRSPSAHISRTPLQLLSAATLKLHELKDYDITTGSDVTPAKLNGIVLGMDPRSPTVEFKRTPIIINASETETCEKIKNKNLDRVKRSVIVTTPKSISKKPVIPPKLIESSPISVKPEISNKRKSFVGLLETNIDFTETDLDEVIREKSKVKEIPQSLSEGTTPLHKQFKTIIQRDNIDPRSPTTDFVRTPIQLVKQMTNLDLSSEANTDLESECIGKEIKPIILAEELEDHRIVEKCVQEICETIHLKTELEKEEEQYILENDIPESSDKTEISFTNNESSVKVTEESQDEDVAEVVVPMETKSAPITPPVTDGKSKTVIPQITKEIKSAPVTPPVVNVTANIKEFDKKLTSLIYRDEDIVICPRKVKLKDYDSRSPLRNLNSNEPEKKNSSQKLKSSHLTKKSEYAVSKIPVFKEKGKVTEIQCENTPPRNLEKRKSKVRRSHWDNADTTLII